MLFYQGYNLLLTRSLAIVKDSSGIKAIPFFFLLFTCSGGLILNLITCCHVFPRPAYWLSQDSFNQSYLT